MVAAPAIGMVSLGCIYLFTFQQKVRCSWLCSSFTENGWLSVDPANRICFKYYHKTSTWWEAKVSCEQEGLFLARPDSESVNKFIYKFRYQWNGFKFWIGGIIEEDSGWKWTNGDKMDYTDFEFFSGTLNRIISFFKKSTSCAMYGASFWSKKSCDELAPYLCQSGRNTTLTAAQIDDGMIRTQVSDSSTKFCYEKSLSTRGPACFVFFEERLTWWDANKTCHEQNMTLVIVRDFGINHLLRRASSYMIVGFWIGAINKDDIGWKWGNGEDMLYNDFNTAIVTLDRLYKQTLCGVFRRVRSLFSGWGKYDCDSFYPFVCDLSGNSDAIPPEKPEISEQTTFSTQNSSATPEGKPALDEQTTSLVPNSTTSPRNSEIHEQTASAGTTEVKSEYLGKPKRKAFKVQKVVGGQPNPKLIHPGTRNVSVSSMVDCCRVCSQENGCELVNFCTKSESCVLYGNFDFAVSGGTSSEPGCSIYVDADKVD